MPHLIFLLQNVGVVFGHEVEDRFLKFHFYNESGVNTKETPFLSGHRSVYYKSWLRCVVRFSGWWLRSH